MFTNNTFIAVAAVIGMLGTASIADAKVAHINNAKARNAYGYVVEGAPASGQFVNGIFIPRGTSSAQVPSRLEEDDYGSEAGKD